MRTSSRADALMAAAALLSGLGCITDTGETLFLAVGDQELFELEVQPALAEGCGNPSCHGNQQRPLELYSVHQHRDDASLIHRDEPLSEPELVANMQRAAAFLIEVDRAEDSPLLTKPLAPAAGGAEHEGNVQFEDRQEPGYQVLHSWAQSVLAGTEELP